jgi:hypothetical protein
MAVARSPPTDAKALVARRAEQLELLKAIAIAK